MHANSGQLVALIAKQCACLSHLTGAESSLPSLVKRQINECSAGVGGQAAKYTFNALDQILLALVGHIVSHLGANGSHRVSTSSQGCKVTGLECTTTVQDDTNLLVGGDLTRRQRGAVRQHFKVTGKVCFEKRHIDIVTPFCSIQLRHWLNNTASQKGITKCSLLNQIRGEDFGDDYIRAKSRHDKLPKECVYGVGAAQPQRSRLLTY